MKSEFAGLRTVAYKVTDLVKAKNWYSQVLGINPYFDEPFYVGFSVAGYELGLVPDESSENLPKADGATTYWGVENVQATYKRLLALGATSHEEPTDVGGDIVVAAVKDPWGNVFGIIYNPHFKLPA
jgi:lactoylglutathione lyase